MISNYYLSDLHYAKIPTHLPKNSNGRAQYSSNSIVRTDFKQLSLFGRYLCKSLLWARWCVQTICTFRCSLHFRKVCLSAQQYLFGYFYCFQEPWSEWLMFHKSWFRGSSAGHSILAKLAWQVSKWVRINSLPLLLNKNDVHQLIIEP